MDTLVVVSAGVKTGAVELLQFMTRPILDAQLQC